MFFARENPTFTFQEGFTVSREGVAISTDALNTAPSNFVCLPLHDILIQNNLFENINAGDTGGTGRVFAIECGNLQAGWNITIDHNTSFESDDFITFGGAQNVNGTVVSQGLVVTNNVSLNGRWGATGGSEGLTQAASGIVLAYGGSGYTIAPTVSLAGGLGAGGVAATATAVLNGSGQVVGFNITNRGSGYTSAPTVSFNNTGTGGSGAAAYATLGNGTVTSIILVDGAGYTSAPAVTISAPGGSGVTATATSLIYNGYVVGFVLTNAGSGYTAAPTVTIGAAPSGGITATATAAIVNGQVNGSVFAGNVLMGVQSSKINTYPAGNFFPTSQDDTYFLDVPGDEAGLLSTSPYFTDGVNSSGVSNSSTPGVNIANILTAMNSYGVANDFVPLDTTLQNYYKFDNSTADNGLSGTQHAATLNGTATYNSSTSAEMNDSLSLGTAGDASATLTPSSSFTFAAWIDPSSTATQYIASTGSSGPFTLSINSTGHLTATTSNGSSVSDPAVITTSNATGPSWTLVGITYDNTSDTLTLYKDGVAVASNAHTGSISTASTTLYIGGNNGTSSDFSGLMDEVRYYTSSLSASQMSYLYAGFGPILADFLPDTGSTQTGTTSTLQNDASGHADTMFNLDSPRSIPAPMSFYWTPYAYEAPGSSTWTLYSTPGNTNPSVTFSDNNDNSAQADTATWTAAGGYILQVTVSDGLGGVTTGLHRLTVAQTLTSIALTPTSATVPNTQTQQFSAVADDQFGAALINQPAITWSVDSGGAGGTVNSSGLYTAPSSGTGSDTVRAASGAVSGTAAVTVILNTPTAPSNLVASPSGYAINLTWNDNSTNESGFHVWRSTDDSTFTDIKALAANTTSWTDSTVLAGVQYYYYVTAYNAAGDSADSNTAAAMTVPTAPTNLSATPGTSSIALAWTNNAGTNESGFHIYRSTTSGSWGSVYATVGQGVTSYTDSAPASGTAYYYDVAAYDATGDSAGTSNACEVATVIAYEGFNYATSNSWAGGNTGVGFAAGWSINNTNEAAILSGSLTYSASGHALTTLGNRLQFTTGGTASATLASSVGTTGSTLWLGFEFSTYHSGTSATQLAGEVDLGASSSNWIRFAAPFNTGVLATQAQVGSYTLNIGGGPTIAANTTYFLAYQIQYLTTGDIISMYVNPQPGGSAPANYTFSGTITLPATAQITTTSTIQLKYAQAGDNPTFDEIRLGTSYAAVAPDPLTPYTPAAHPYTMSSLLALIPSSSFSLQQSEFPTTASFLSTLPIPTASIDISIHFAPSDYHLDNTSNDLDPTLDSATDPLTQFLFV